MLTLPPLVESMVRRGNFAKATPEDIALVRSIPPLPVPESYIEFITRFGYVDFDPVDDPCELPYQYREPSLSMEFEAVVSTFMKAANVKRYYTGLVVEEDEDLPKFPAFMLPICHDYGQSHVLLECGGEQDRVWYWEFQGEAWGKGSNVRLGFVADSFQGFLEKLRVPAG
jgi:hypothetical protein